MVGSVRVIYFAKNFKSQFRDGSVIRQLSYSELLKVRVMDVWWKIDEDFIHCIV